MQPTIPPCDVLVRDVCASNWRATVEYIVTLVESEAVRQRLPDGSVWWDIRPMVSADEQPPECIDINREWIDHGLHIGVLGRSPVPELQHLVHINGAA